MAKLTDNQITHMIEFAFHFYRGDTANNKEFDYLRQILLVCNTTYSVANNNWQVRDYLQSILNSEFFPKTRENCTVIAIAIEYFRGE